MAITEHVFLVVICMKFRVRGHLSIHFLVTRSGQLDWIPVAQRAHYVTCINDSIFLRDNFFGKVI